jgi:hypothetical protein
MLYLVNPLQGDIEVVDRSLLEASTKIYDGNYCVRVCRPSFITQLKHNASCRIQKNASNRQLVPADAIFA